MHLIEEEKQLLEASQYTEAVAQMYSVKKVFLKLCKIQNKKNHLCRILIFNKVAGLRFEETPTQMFSS